MPSLARAAVAAAAAAALLRGASGARALQAANPTAQPSPPPPPPPNATALCDTLDVAILSFALNLEYLEAQSYNFNLFGTGLSQSDLGVGGVAATGAYVANLSPGVQAFGLELAATERKHVQFIRSALGACAPPAPAIDLSTNAFGTLVNAAFFEHVHALNLDPANGDLPFLLSAFIYEDVGVTAYGYASGLLSSYALINYAGSLQATEAYHSGAVRALLIAQASAVAGVGANYTVGQVAGAISALRAALGGGGKDVGVEVYGSATVQGGGSIVPAVAPLNPLNGLTFSRTPAQVLAIVTGGGAHGAGLFFPNGLSLGPGAAAWLGL